GAGGSLPREHGNVVALRGERAAKLARVRADAALHRWVLPGDKADAHPRLTPQPRAQHLPVGAYALAAQRALVAQHELGPLDGDLCDVVGQQHRAHTETGQPPVVLAEVAHLARLEVDVALRGDLLTALAAVVHDPGGREVHDLPARRLDAALPVK